MAAFRSIPALLCGALLLGACAVSNDEKAAIADIAPVNTLSETAGADVTDSDADSPLIVAASRDTTANYGVANWRISVGDSNLAYQIEGLDADGSIVTSTIMRVAMDADGNPQSLSFEHSLPKTEFGSIAADGTYDLGNLSEFGGGILDAVSHDLQPLLEDANVAGANGRYTCLKWALLTIAACGGSIALCVFTFGNPGACIFGFTACWWCAVAWSAQCW